MKRLFFAGALVSVLFLLIGTYLFPADVVMWFASTAPSFTLVRTSMALILLVVLFTTPPRSLRVRLLMGFASVAFTGAGLAVSLSDSLHILDIILFFQLGIALGIEALELNEDELSDEVLALREQYARQQAAEATALDSQGLRNVQLYTYLTAR